MKYKTHFITGDGHTAPYQNLDRYKYLGFYLAKTQPDVWVDLGDLVTFDSCSFFDVPRLEKTTAKEDLDAADAALCLVEHEIERHNESQRKMKKAQYRPRKVFCHGNHEFRFNRRMQQDADVLGSLVNLDDLLRLNERFDDVVQYRDLIEINGILYSHAVHNSLGKPMGGVTRGRMINAMSNKPVIYGHTHKFDYTSSPIIGNNNSTRWSLNICAFMDQDHVEKYAAGGTTGWAYGAIELKVYEDGNSVYRWVSMAELKEFYERNKD